MITKEIYLLNPYTDVIKVNAVGDCDFKLHLNGAIHYTIAELIEKVNSVPYIGDEDNQTRITRWLSALNANIKDRQYAYVDVGHPLINVNSYSDNICGGISSFVYQTFCLFFPEHYAWIIMGGVSGVGGHQWNAYDGGHYDNINKMPTYKGKYIGASVDEIKADKTLYTEPLKINIPGHITSAKYNQYFYGTIPGYDKDDDVTRLSAAEVRGTLDNLKMKMPNGSSFVFPVKSANELNVEHEAFQIPTPVAAMICTFPTGVTGAVEMPVNVYQITGTGTVSVKGITYTLPTDEAALKVVLQDSDLGEGMYTLNHNFYNSFTILTNTCGISCEFLVNRKTWMLFRDNIIQYEITTGSLTFERFKAAIPLDTVIVSVDKGASPSFTINFDRWFTVNKSFRIPTPYNPWDPKCITFSKDVNNKQPIPQWIFNNTVPTLTVVTAGTPVIDQCFCSRLTPKDESFATTLELSFTAIDGASTYYTVDGSTPDATKTLYAAPFTISATTTIKWIAVKADYANSHINTRVITKTA